MWVRSLGQEYPLEEGMATHSHIFAWRIPMDRGAWQGEEPVHGVAKSQTQLKQLSTDTCTGILGDLMKNIYFSVSLALLSENY